MLWFPRLLLLLLLMHAFAVALQVEGVRELLAAVLAAEALHAAVQHEVARQGRLPFKLPVSPRVADPDPAFFLIEKSGSRSQCGSGSFLDPGF
jgi:hypothetical protein